MPDLTIETYHHCRSALELSKEVAGSHGETYVVTLSRQNPGPCRSNWHCTCPAFRYRRGDCKHIRRVRADDHCGWAEFLDGGEPDRDANGNVTCPRCGGPAEAMGWAV